MHETKPARPGRADLSDYALLSIGVSLVVIALKLTAWWVSGSVSLLSDAAESVVNVVAALGAFIALRVAARPPDERHNFGHTKAEYFSAVFEGVLIVVAAGTIIYVSIERLVNPSELDEVGLGLIISVVATVVNAGTGFLLVRVGRSRRSLSLEADGHHLLTDVWTTVGVIIGLVLVQLTGWTVLDPIIAIAVAINILLIGIRIVRRSGSGLLDSALPDGDRSRVDAVLDRHRGESVQFHHVRTRTAGHQRFVQFHMLVPGDWTVDRSHRLTEQIEQELTAELEDLHVSVHVEPTGASHEESPHSLG